MALKVYLGKNRAQVLDCRCGTTVTKLYVMIPYTISFQTRLFPTLGNEPKNFNEFVKSVQTEWKSIAFAMFIHIVVT